MTDNTLKYPFVTSFLASFSFAGNIMPFTDDELYSLDRELSAYERLITDPDIEKNLISKNELLASFGISKAENSTLTLKEAEGVYKILLEDPDYDFIGQKIRGNKKLTRKDHDKLEFFNVVRTFREINRREFLGRELSPDIIKQVHLSLTRGMDIFEKHLIEFTPYRSGTWRNNDLIRIADHVPMPHLEIENAIVELIDWLKKNFTPMNVALFHSALYAIHPFNNGNKRVCRVLEHLLLRQIGLNKENLYSTSYYYHKEKDRYYKYLLATLEKKNLNYFTSFVLEAILLSIISVLKTGIETKRNKFMHKQNFEATLRSVISPLIKRHELQFKDLYKLTKRKMARQTFVTYLAKVVETGALRKREAGRQVFYRLNLDLPEEETYKKWLSFAIERLTYIPDEIKLV